MNEKEKELVSNYVLDQIKAVSNLRHKVKYEDFPQNAHSLFKNLLDANTPLHNACQYTEDAIRFVKQYLADIGMHTPALELAVLQNTYRAKCYSALGIKSKLRRKKFREFIHGYLGSWKNVLRLALYVVFLSTVSLYLFNLISGHQALMYTNDQSKDVPLIYYPYFSIVTFATLGYGDISPNVMAPGGLIPAYIAAVEAVFGYIVLSLFIVVLINIQGAHTTIRAERWFNDYENDILGDGIKYFRGDFEYNSSKKI